VDIIDRGSGPPLVLIPGLQGRWEYLRPAVDALSVFFRVLTFSLGDGDLDAYAQQVASVLSRKGIDRATICGVSFGGRIAVRFAAQNPSRCDALILVSTPRPALRLRRRHEIYVSAPWLFGPIFLAESPLRLRPEICAAIPDARVRRRFMLQGLRTLLSAPVSFSRMAGRAKLATLVDLGPDCERITAPTLVLTGERHLDHVVPVEGAADYVRLIPDARAAVLERTGHLGSITRPDLFAATVRDFVCAAGIGSRAVGSSPDDRSAQPGAASTRGRVA
jgi:pimeloyl-ACP methyl ester carboxylesterase